MSRITSVEVASLQACTDQNMELGEGTRLSSQRVGPLRVCTATSCAKEQSHKAVSFLATSDWCDFILSTTIVSAYRLLRVSSLANTEQGQPELIMYISARQCKP